MLPETGVVLACVSGGADSMCMLDALLHISRERGFSVSAAHFNHRLRGEESDRDENFVREQCAAVSVPFFHSGGNVRELAAKEGLNLEAAARDLRYRFFYATASSIGAARIATAHTADDNAETMLMNLARGAGAAGLSGIPPVRGIVIRPMLCVTRDEVMRYVNMRGISYVQDSTNGLDVFTRNRIRHSVIPVLKEVNPRLTDAASAAAALSRADDEYLSQLADGFIAEHCPRPALLAREVNVGELLKLPYAISGRVIRKLHGSSLSHRHVTTILESCRKDGPPVRLSLPGSTVYVEYGRVVFCQKPAAEGFQPVCLSCGDSAEIPELNLRITCKPVEYSVFSEETTASFRYEDDRIYKTFTSFLFKSVDICGKMTVRSRREGDAIRLSGRGVTKTLKKLFIELRIPARERTLIPVVADEAGVLAIYGLGAGDRAAPQPGEQAVRIDFDEYQAPEASAL